MKPTVVSGVPSCTVTKRNIRTPFCHTKGTVHDRQEMMAAGKVLPISRIKLAEWPSSPKQQHGKATKGRTLQGEELNPESSPGAVAFTSDVSARTSKHQSKPCTLQKMEPSSQRATGRRTGDDHLENKLHKRGSSPTPRRRCKSISPEFSRGVSGTQGKCHPEIFISGQFPPPEGSPSPEGLHGLHGGILHGLHCFHGSLAGSHGWSGQRRRHLLVVTGKLGLFNGFQTIKALATCKLYEAHGLCFGFHGCSNGS